MALEKILKAIPITLAVGTIGLCTGLIIHSEHMRKNLEPNAIYCGLNNNTVGFPDWGINNPKMKNTDIDGNGKYESILLYKNKEGKKVYQEIRKKENGELVFSKQRPYK